MCSTWKGRTDDVVYLGIHAIGHSRHLCIYLHISPFLSTLAPATVWWWWNNTVTHTTFQHPTHLPGVGISAIAFALRVRCIANSRRLLQHLLRDNTPIKLRISDYHDFRCGSLHEFEIHQLLRSLSVDILHPALNGWALLASRTYDSLYFSAWQAAAGSVVSALRAADLPLCSHLRTHDLSSIWTTPLGVSSQTGSISLPTISKPSNRCSRSIF